MISRVSDPESRSRENATAHSFHVVLALGAVNENCIRPLSSVVSIGRKNADGISGMRYSSAVVPASVPAFSAAYSASAIGAPPASAAANMT